MIIGSVTVHAKLFATGEFIYGRPVTAAFSPPLWGGVFVLRRLWSGLSPQSEATSDS